MTKMFNIKGIGAHTEYNGMNFVQRIPMERKIRDWMGSAKSVHISMKRRTSAAAIREFKDLYKPESYYCAFHDEPNYRDDSFEVFYTTKQ